MKTEDTYSIDEWNLIVVYYQGIIDEFRIYNRALLPEEITALYGRREYTGIEPIASICYEDDEDITRGQPFKMVV